MPFYTFFTNIPNAPDDAADDQPDMLINTKSTNTIMNVDHYTFNGNPVGNKGGYHRQLTLYNEDTPFVPSIGMSGAFYSTSKKGDAWPHWKNSAGPKAGTALTVGRVLSKANGYAYIPGGLIIQWGLINKIKLKIGGIPFGDTFPIPFKEEPYFVFLQGCAENSTSNSRLLFNVTKKNKVEFKFDTQTPLDSTLVLDNIYWTAIGLA